MPQSFVQVWFRGHYKIFPKKVKFNQTEVSQEIQKIPWKGEQHLLNTIVLSKVELHKPNRNFFSSHMVFPLAETEIKISSSSIKHLTEKTRHHSHIENKEQTLRICRQILLGDSSKTPRNCCSERHSIQLSVREQTSPLDLEKSPGTAERAQLRQ